MIENILQMLEIAKREKKIGKVTHRACCKKKRPETINEGYKMFTQ